MLLLLLPLGLVALFLVGKAKSSAATPATASSLTSQAQSYLATGNSLLTAGKGAATSLGIPTGSSPATVAGNPSAPANPGSTSGASGGTDDGSDFGDPGDADDFGSPDDGDLGDDDD